MEAAADAGLSRSSGADGRGSPDSDADGFGATAPDPAAATLAGSLPSGASPLTDAGTTATAGAGAAEGAAAGKPHDPAAPVPVVDDQGRPVLIPEGPLKGQRMLRPAALAPHFFVKQGTADKSDYDALINNLNPNPFGGDDAGLGFLSREIMQLSKFNHFRE